MESKQKIFVGLTVTLSVIGVGLLVAAFATDKWVSASPYRDTDNSTVREGQDINTGNSSFGLFNGQQSLNYGTGARPYSLSVACEASEGVCVYVFMRPGTEAMKKLEDLIARYKKSNATGYSQIQHGLFSFPLWVCTIVFLSLSIVMGLVAIGFAIFNIAGRPIETITGPMGLYVWNGLSLLFTTVTLAVFGGLFGTQLSENFMMVDDYEIGWRSKGHTDLDYSFYFIVGAAGAFLLNIILLCVSGQSVSCSYWGSGEKEVDNGMILY
ncbi:clarin-3-like [Babylonia areolata]|uniref:clarin-3-like n=1 Tax=Babylonia areolata TaxID=304850 RepID=UPI003FD002E2